MACSELACSWATVLLIAWSVFQISSWQLLIKDCYFGFRLQSGDQVEALLAVLNRNWLTWYWIWHGVANVHHKGYTVCVTWALLTQYPFRYACSAVIVFVLADGDETCTTLVKSASCTGPFVAGATLQLSADGPHCASGFNRPRSDTVQPEPRNIAVSRVDDCVEVRHSATVAQIGTWATRKPVRSQPATSAQDES